MVATAKSFADQRREINNAARRNFIPWSKRERHLSVHP